MAQTFNCPKCGAPLDVDGDASTIHCKYCHETVVVPEELRMAKIPAPEKKPRSIGKARQAPRVILDTPQESAGEKRWPIVYLMSFWLLVILISLAIWGAYSFLAKINHEYRVVGPVALIEKPGSEIPDLFLPIYDVVARSHSNGQKDELTHQFILLDGNTHKILWRTDPTSIGAKAYAAGKQIYILDETILTAYDRQGGKNLWQVTLDNGTGSCKTCLEQYGSQVLIILKDGTIQAVDASSGKLTWKKTLNNVSADLFTIAGKPAVKEIGDGNKPIFFIFDPDSGQVIQTLKPECNQYALEEYRMSEDGKSMVLMFNDCIQRISVPDGKVLTQAVPAKDEAVRPNTWINTHYLINQDSIYYTEDAQGYPVDMFDMAAWNGQELIKDQKYALVPKLIHGTVLIVEATPGYDFNQKEYWGIELQTGNRIWQVPLKGQGRLVYEDIHAITNEVFIVQCRQGPDECSWMIKNTTTGADIYSGKTAGAGIVYATWGKNKFYLGVIGAGLRVIDTGSGKLLYQWP